MAANVKGCSRRSLRLQKIIPPPPPLISTGDSVFLCNVKSEPSSAGNNPNSKVKKVQQQPQMVTRSVKVKVKPEHIDEEEDEAFIATEFVPLMPLLEPVVMGMQPEPPTDKKLLSNNIQNSMAPAASLLISTRKSLRLQTKQLLQSSVFCQKIKSEPLPAGNNLNLQVGKVQQQPQMVTRSSSVQVKPEPVAIDNDAFTTFLPMMPLLKPEATGACNNGKKLLKSVVPVPSLTASSRKSLRIQKIPPPLLSTECSRKKNRKTKQKKVVHVISITHDVDSNSGNLDECRDGEGTEAADGFNYPPIPLPLEENIMQHPEIIKILRECGIQISAEGKLDSTKQIVPTYSTRQLEEVTMLDLDKLQLEMEKMLLDVSRRKEMLLKLSGAQPHNKVEEVTGASSKAKSTRKRGKRHSKSNNHGVTVPVKIKVESPTMEETEITPEEEEKAEKNKAFHQFVDTYCKFGPAEVKVIDQLLKEGKYDTETATADTNSNTNACCSSVVGHAPAIDGECSNKSEDGPSTSSSITFANSLAKNPALYTKLRRDSVFIQQMESEAADLDMRTRALKLDVVLPETCKVPLLAPSPKISPFLLSPPASPTPIKSKTHRQDARKSKNDQKFQVEKDKLEKELKQVRLQNESDLKRLKALAMASQRYYARKKVLDALDQKIVVIYNLIEGVKKSIRENGDTDGKYGQNLARFKQQAKALLESRKVLTAEVDKLEAEAYPEESSRLIA